MLLSLLRLAALLAVAGLAVATALSFLGAWHWALELLTHFRVQATAAAAVVTLGAWLVGLRLAAAVALACAAAQGAPVLPYLLPRPEPPPLAAPPLRLLLLNVLTVNEHRDAVATLVAREDPDVVGLLEVDERWLRALAPLSARYPHRAARAQADNFGVALWSRVPIANLSLRRLERDTIYAAVGELVIEGRPTLLMLAHPVPPVGRRLTALRNRQLDAIARIRSEFPDHEAILLGDLNTSPWSPSYARLEERAGLANAARGIGPLPTWPTPSPWLRVPIDHCLLSPGLRAVSVRLGPEVGSDHLPVIVDVVRARDVAGASAR